MILLLKIVAYGALYFLSAIPVCMVLGKMIAMSTTEDPPP